MLVGLVVCSCSVVCCFVCFCVVFLNCLIGFIGFNKTNYCLYQKHVFYNVNVFSFFLQCKYWFLFIGYCSVFIAIIFKKTSGPWRTPWTQSQTIMNNNLTTTSKPASAPTTNTMNNNIYIVKNCVWSNKHMFYLDKIKPIKT